MKKPEIGNYVIKNEENWKPNNFDSWGRGVGVGIVLTPPNELLRNEIDVRWPGGRCFESTDQVKIFEFKPQAGYSISNAGGIEVMLSRKDDLIYYRFVYGQEDVPEMNIAKIEYYEKKCKEYFMHGKSRFWLDQFISLSKF